MTEEFHVNIGLKSIIKWLEKNRSRQAGLVLDLDALTHEEAVDHRTVQELIKGFTEKMEKPIGATLLLATAETQEEQEQAYLKLKKGWGRLIRALEKAIVLHQSCTFSDARSYAMQDVASIAAQVFGVARKDRRFIKFKIEGESIMDLLGPSEIVAVVANNIKLYTKLLNDKAHEYLQGEMQPSLTKLDQPYFLIRDLANAVEVAESTIRKWERVGKIQAIKRVKELELPEEYRHFQLKHPELRVIPQSEIYDWIDACRVLMRPEGYLTSAQYCEQKGVSRNTLSRWRKNGKVCFKQVEGRYYYLP